MLILDYSLDTAEPTLRIVDSCSGRVVAQWRGHACRRTLASAQVNAADLGQTPGSDAMRRAIRNLLFEFLVEQVTGTLCTGPQSGQVVAYSGHARHGARPAGHRSRDA